MINLMKAVAVTGIHDVRLIDIEKPLPRQNEVQVRIRACALCTWEQRIFSGETKTPYPIVGGHEVAGEISAIGEGVDPAAYPIGARVGIRVVKCCHSCYYCRRGKENLCVELNTFRMNGPDVFGMGGLAEYISVDRSAVWMYPDDTPYETISLTEPLACVVNSVGKGHPQFGDDVVVIGGGVMGMLHILCSKLMGTRVILSEPDPIRRGFAKRLGCDIVLDPSNMDAAGAVLDLTEGRGAEVVYNTTAISSVAAQAIKMTGRLGRCVMYSSQHPDSPVGVSPNWLHSSEAVLTGAVSPSIASFDRAVNLLSKGLINVQPLISAVLPFEHAFEAFTEAAKPDTFRIIVSF